jgi:hypothetical protein
VRKLHVTQIGGDGQLTAVAGLLGPEPERGEEPTV